MDYMTIAVNSAITALVGGVVGAIVATVVSMVKDKRRNDGASDQALREGIKELLMDRAETIVEAAMAAGEISIRNRAKVHTLTRIARTLGANGESHELDRIADEIPTKHD